MKLEDFRAIARPPSINHGRYSSPGAIRLVLANEVNFDCYATARDGDCDHEGCCLRDDCLGAVQGRSLS